MDYAPVMSVRRPSTHASRLFALSLAAFVATAATPVLAHVKWFSRVAGSTPPRTLSEILTPTFWSLMALSVVGLGIATLLDKRVTELPTSKRLAAWLEDRRPLDLVVMRVATFATLLVAWQQNTLITPELHTVSDWSGALQFSIIVCLLLRATTPLAGFGLGALWCLAAWRFGAFHMLDYVNVLGVAFFLIVRPSKNERWRELALPVMYGTVGFSLVWLAAEKLVFPDWGLDVLASKPELTMGLPLEFFLCGAAFVEFALGYMLIVGLFGRALSVTITITFILTSLVFGRTEVIGHTLIHGSLLVFLLHGPGHTFTPPARFHRKALMRLLFVVVNFVLLTFAVVAAYASLASPYAPTAIQNAEADPHAGHHQPYEVPEGVLVPSLVIEVTEDSESGWNVSLTTTNFEFAPEEAGSPHVEGRGHVHLYVDGEKVARVYGPAFHLPPLDAGTHEVRATLNTNAHRTFASGGEVIEASASVTVP